VDWFIPSLAQNLISRSIYMTSVCLGQVWTIHRLRRWDSATFSGFLL
jgi:hypothetical protein